MRASGALLVTVLLLSIVTVTPIAASAGTAHSTGIHPRIVPVENTSNYLGINSSDVRRKAVSATGLDVGVAVEMDAHRLRSDFRVLATQQAFAEADTTSEKYVTLITYLESAGDTTDRLQRRDRASIAAFSNGTMSARAFLRERARIAKTASDLQAAVNTVQTTASADTEFELAWDLHVQFENVEARLEVLAGPVSDHVYRAKTGEADRRLVYSAGAGDGYTMMVLTDGKYVRETYVGSERRPNGTDSFAQADGPRENVANTRGYELYPWVSNRTLSPATRALGSSGIYRFRTDFPSGDLTAYIDGNTTNVFREYQVQHVSAMPISDRLAATNGTLRVRINRTYETGPMHLSVDRSTTGITTNATISIDGTSVGTTGSDGRIWLVEPPHPVTVTVTAEDGDRVSLRIPPA